MSGILLDSNILVYAYIPDPSELKVIRAIDALRRAAEMGNGCVTVQNLAEFSAVALNKAKPPRTPAETKGSIRQIEALFTVLSPSAHHVHLALDAVARHQLSFWDAMLWAVAKDNGIAEIWTEDFEHGRAIEGVLFKNPLKE
jgi:predicted nucleic acid-binding protein